MPNKTPDSPEETSPDVADRSLTATPAGGSATELLPPPASEDVVDQVVATLNNLTRVQGLDLALQIGRVVVHGLYNGDVTVLRGRTEKDASLRKLAERSETGALHLSVPVLFRAIAIFEMTERLGVSTWEHLGVSHLRLVLGLAHGQQQRLLANAEEQEWTVEELEAAAAKIRSKSKAGNGGRKRMLPFVKGIGRLAKLFANQDETFGGLDQIDNLDEDEALRLYQAVTGMKIKCEEMQQALAKRVPGMSE